MISMAQAKKDSLTPSKAKSVGPQAELVQS